MTSIAITWMICAAVLVAVWRITTTVLELQAKRNAELVVRLEEESKAAIEAIDRAIREVDAKVRNLEAQAAMTRGRGRHGVGGT